MVEAGFLIQLTADRQCRYGMRSARSSCLFLLSKLWTAIGFDSSVKYISSAKISAIGTQ